MYILVHVRDGVIWSVTAQEGFDLLREKGLSMAFDPARDCNAIFEIPRRAEDRKECAQVWERTEESADED